MFIAQQAGFLHHLRSPAINMHVDTHHIAEAQHAQGLISNAIVEQILFDTFSLWNNIGGTAASDRIRQHQQSSLQAFCRRKDQTCECMYPYRHMRQPGRNHTEQSGLRCHGMHHRRPFLTEYLYQAI